MDDKRTLSNADVEAITEQLERSLLRKFQLNVGKGVLGVVWRVFIYALIAVAAYGAGGGLKKIF
jgi:hypothetical protein